MPALAEEHTVVVPDLRGIGESSLEESGYDKETLAEDVHGLVRGLGFEEVSVVGHDMGAMTAYAYAREHREETSHLVLMGPPSPASGWRSSWTSRSREGDAFTWSSSSNPGSRRGS